jgi:signal peptidase I
VAENNNRPSEDDDDLDTSDDRGAGRRFLDWVWDLVKTWGPALLTVLLIRSVLAEPFRIPSGSMVPTLQIGDHILVTKFSYGFRIPLTRVPLSDLKVPARGDIVVFVYPPEDDPKGISYWVDLPFPSIDLHGLGLPVTIPGTATLDYVKRVVGLPGDTIQVKSNVLYINGVAQEQRYEDDYTFIDAPGCRENPTRRLEESLGDMKHSMLVSSSYGEHVPDYGPKTIPDDHIFVMGDNRDHSADSRFWGLVPLRAIKGKAHYIWLSYDQCKQGIPIFGEFRSDRFPSSLY